MEEKKKSINVSLQSWQKDCYKLINDHPTNSFIVIKSARQRGKSFLLSVLCLSRSINNPGSVSICISPTLSQSRKMFKDIIKMLGTIPVIQSSNSTLLEIEFTNGSQLLFKSAEQGEALRGFTVRGGGVLVIDEGVFIKDDIFGLVFPYVNVSKASVVITSTPLFRNGMFYDLYSKGLNGDGNIYSFDVMNYDTSFFLNEEQKQLYFETMPSTQFRTEILGEFIDEFSDTFGEFKDVCNNTYDPTDTNFFMGVDFGSGTQNDNTVITIMNSRKQMVDLCYFNDLSAQDTIDKILEYAVKWNVRKITIESNSIGNVFYSLLQDKNRGRFNISKFTTTNESKNQIINRLQLAIQKKEVQLLDDIELKIEFANYQIESTKNGKITYNGKKGFKDDIVMSTAICLESITNGGNSTFFFI